MALTLLSSACQGPKGGNDVTFDGQAWRAQRGASIDAPNPRSGMISKLQREVLKPGLERREVLELLGPPDSSREETDFYDLGRAAFGPDYEQFAIEYRQGRLVRAWLVRT